MTEEQIPPWYRQFWPWFLIALPASAVIAGLYTVWLAMQSTDSLVAPPGEGMEIVTERRNAAERQARLLGLDASITIEPESGAVNVRMAGSGATEWPPSLTLLFSHPTNGQLDRTISLGAGIPDADGAPRWAGHISPVPSGRWYLVLNAADEWRLYGVWTGGRTIRLRPETASTDAQQ